MRGMGVCRPLGFGFVIVRGDPRVYSRFSFSAELAKPITSPFSGRPTWQAAELIPGALEGVRGWVNYPPPFRVACGAQS